MQTIQTPRRLAQIQKDVQEKLDEEKLKLHHLRYDLAAPIRQLANETAQHFVTVLDKDHGADDSEGRWSIQGVPAWSGHQPLLMRGINLWMDVLEGDTAAEIRRANILMCADAGQDGDAEPKTEIVIPRKGEVRIVIVQLLNGWEFCLRRFPSKAKALEHIERCGGTLKD